jgi:hypothetical protein
VQKKPKSALEAFGHTDADHKKTAGDIALLFKNIMSVSKGLSAEFDKKIKGIKIYHKDLEEIGPDDHHKEKHTLESHLGSKLMTQLLDLIKNPPQGKTYMHGGGATFFNQLGDVPIAYTNKANRLLKVKATEDGIDFGIKISVGTSAPTNPAVDDIWIDTN